MNRHTATTTGTVHSHRPRSRFELVLHMRPNLWSFTPYSSDSARDELCRRRTHTPSALPGARSRRPKTRAESLQDEDRRATRKLVNCYINDVPCVKGLVRTDLSQFQLNLVA